MKTKLAKIGYVANSFNTVLGDFISAGRLYEYIGGMCNPRKLINLTWKRNSYKGVEIWAKNYY